jgi:hypothetical protein
MLKIIKLTLALFVVVFFSTCKKDCCQDPSNPKCENYDPCYGKTRINADFRVRPGDNGFKPPEEWCDLVPCDTLRASSARFDMPVNNPSNSTYIWQIGTEPTPRTGKAIEVDFSNYLDAGNYEKYIPITLTIRTPLNSCMTHPGDTLIKVTREIFFTQKKYHPYISDSSFSVFEGFLIDNPNVTFKIRTSGDNEEWYKKLRTFGNRRFLIGFPFADTILMPWDIFVKNGCGNFKHWREVTISYQNPQMFELFNEYSHGLMQQDYYYLGGKEYLFRLEFHKQGKVIVRNFRCTKLQ